MQGWMLILIILALVLIVVAITYRVSRSQQKIIQWLPAIVLLVATLICAALVQMLQDYSVIIYYLLSWVLGICLIASILFTFLFQMIRKKFK